MYALRRREIEVVHDRDELRFAPARDARVEHFLLAYAADAPTLVVVGRVDQRLVRQREQLFGDAVVHLHRAALLEVGAAAGIDHQRVAGEQPVAPQVAQAAQRVPRRCDDVYRLAAERQRIAIIQQPVITRCAAVLGDHRGGAGMLPKCLRTGDVVGMHMGIQYHAQRQLQRLEQREVTIDVLQYRIDDDRTALFAGEQIGEGGRFRVEHLAEDHVVPSWSGVVTNCIGKPWACKFRDARPAPARPDG